jgi:hypothetical protein
MAIILLGPSKDAANLLKALFFLPICGPKAHILQAEPEAYVLLPVSFLPLKIPLELCKLMVNRESTPWILRM